MNKITVRYHKDGECVSAPWEITHCVPLPYIGDIIDTVADVPLRVIGRRWTPELVIECARIVDGEVLS